MPTAGAGQGANNTSMVQAQAPSAEQPFGTLMDGGNVGVPDGSSVVDTEADTLQAPEMSLDFDLHGENVLESFDFDSFLNTEDGAGGSLSFDMPSLPYANPDGLEAGSGDI